MRMLDLFCGRLGWSKAFLARGWDVTAIDLVEPSDLPRRAVFMKDDVMNVEAIWCSQFHFICASPPCEEFSVHGMKYFHPNPKYPENGIRLFNHTREICEASGVPYVMENVRAAQQFVGRAVHHCGPFYLWGTGVPAIMPQGIRKNYNTSGISAMRGEQYRNLSIEEKRVIRDRLNSPGRGSNDSHKLRTEEASRTATIPPELANCVAEYAERLLEQRASTLDDDCPDCMGTGNFYGNDEDGDFLGCDSCRGTGVRDAGVEVKPDH